jgi:hypothetical protein
MDLVLANPPHLRIIFSYIIFVNGIPSLMAFKIKLSSEAAHENAQSTTTFLSRYMNHKID